MSLLATALLLAGAACCVYACVYFAQETFVHNTTGASFGFTAPWIFGIGFAFFAVLVFRGPSTSLPLVGVGVALIVAGKLIEWFVLGPIVDRIVERRQKGPPS